MIDLSRFTALEIGGCVNDDDAIIGGIAAEAADFFTVYGRLKPDADGCALAEAIDDFATFTEAEDFAHGLADPRALPVVVTC